MCAAAPLAEGLAKATGIQGGWILAVAKPVKLARLRRWLGCGHTVLSPILSAPGAI